MRVYDAIRDAGAARFRPIVLTSLTTFVGLLPLLLERSFQAQFLVPMAVSLAFGVLFATAITLVLVPSLYAILERLPVSARGPRTQAARASCRGRDGGGARCGLSSEVGVRQFWHFRSRSSC